MLIRKITQQQVLHRGIILKVKFKFKFFIEKVDKENDKLKVFFEKEGHNHKQILYRQGG